MAPTTASLSKTLAKLRRGAPIIPSPPPVKYVPQPPPSSSSFSTSAPSIPESPSTSTSQPQEKDSSRWSKLLLFVPGAITFGLGTWQIFRRQEKIKMLEYRQNRLEMEPIKCNNIAYSSQNLNSLEFRKVLFKGVFDEKKSIYIGPRSRSISGVTENGYYIITPLMPIPDNPDSVQLPVLVNRGWVPRIWKDNSLKASQDDGPPLSIAPTSVQETTKSSWWRVWSKKPDIVKEQVPDVTPVEVVGVVRGSEKPSIFVPANDPSSFQWFYVDVPAIACACGLPENTIYIEDINDNVNPSNPYPVPKDSSTLIRSSVMPQDHLNYTLTWYSLSAAVTFMAFKRLKQKKSRR
ncbi:hypothetical protein LguiB_007506 [Lonicera macranthoides]